MLECLRRAAARIEATLSTRRAVAWSTILLFGQCAALAFMIAGTHGMIVRLKQPVTTDFSSFYAAGSLADSGRPDLAYHRAAHYAAEQRATAPGVAYNYFYYPPVFLLLCAGLGRLPYMAAFLAFEAATLTLFALAARRILDGRRWLALLPVLAFPPVFWTLGLGQNAFLSAGLFAWATLLLRQRREAVSGLLFGAICFKPHLGILIPFALAGGRRWRAFAAAACAVTALAALSVLVFGLHTWHDFLASLAATPDVYQSGRIGFDVMVSVFGAARLLGLPVGWAEALQATASAAMAVLVFWTWRSPGTLATRCAVLLAASIIAAPLVLFYDLMLLGVAMAWLVRAGRDKGFLRFEKLGMLAALAPVAVARSATLTLHVPLGLLAAALVLGLALRRQHVEAARGRPQPPRAPGGAGRPRSDALVIRRPALAAMSLALLLRHGGAQAAAPGCEGAAQAAEAAWRLPPGLLAAIGRVETGRWNPAARKVIAWPWAVDVGGRDYYSDSLPGAVALVQSLQMQGIRSIDVGCFQVNLQYHPDAFADLASAFDPMSNGMAAGRFLASLHDRSGDWRSAVGLYHSATPGQSERYRERVYLSLNGGAGLPPGLALAAPSLFDAVVVMMSSAAARVRVFGPPDSRSGPAAGSTRRGLPAVFTPSPTPS